MIRSVADDKVLVGMIALAGLIAVCVGSSLTVAMPNFADTLGAGDEDGLGYGLLLFANGIGGVIGGFLLEATGLIKADVKAAIVAAVMFGLTSLIVATTSHYGIALAALVLGGIANLAATSVGQAIVQLRAPADRRGRVVGVYGMVGSGMRTGNGITIAWLGALVGVSGAVAVGGISLMVGAVLIAVLTGLQTARGRRA